MFLPVIGLPLEVVYLAASALGIDFCTGSEVGMGQSIWNSFEQKGFSRREFLEFCRGSRGAGPKCGRPSGFGLREEGEAGGGVAAFSGVHLLQRVVHSRLSSDGD
jgi:hypothetical protein